MADLTRHAVVGRPAAAPDAAAAAAAAAGGEQMRMWTRM